MWTHEFRCEVPAAPEHVFAALTDPAQLNRWFAESVDVALGAGGRGQPTDRRWFSCSTRSAGTIGST